MTMTDPTLERRPERDRPAGGQAADKALRARPQVAAWLLATAAMVAAMVVIGGITRLTESGLSMVEWRPLMGWIPPLTEAEWERVFALYRQTPEYRLHNAWMTLSDFETIFFWEYLHRVWGRLIGVVFALPFLAFLAAGRLERALAPRLAALFVLGAIQGGIGWWMVTSGLADEPEVSPYRLATHLSMAFLIRGVLLWSAHDLLSPRPAGATPALRAGATAVLALVSLTVLAGAFVAGTDAGYAYNTFPLMDGSFVPEGYWEQGLAGMAEWVPAVQFNHRWLAVGTALATLGFCHWAGRRAPDAARLPLRLLAVAVAAQVALGIAALLLVVPVWLGALHQAGAVALFSTAVWTRFSLRA
ncbi:MAG: COX15/CtaA family protein [Thalassobaculum sp.]|uniref:COX15/CtaA family protein n=1 Tax=Thalassobaculum sp. TaxID=2022740 RepID=UPI0032EBF216